MSSGMGGLRDERAVTAALVFDVVGGRDPAWAVGPLAVPVPDWALAEGWVTSAATGRTARATYFTSGVMSALNGPESAPFRWWSELHADLDGAAVWAVELLRLDRTSAPRGLLALHVTLSR